MMRRFKLKLFQAEVAVVPEFRGNKEPEFELAVQVPRLLRDAVGIVDSGGTDTIAKHTFDNNQSGT